MCGFWPCTSGDWASWIQAIGTLLAIGAAWWIARGESEASRKRMIDEAYREKAEQAMMAVLFARTLESRLNEGARVNEAEAYENAALLYRAIEDLLTWGRKIELVAIPREMVDPTMKLRALAAQALWYEGRSTSSHVAGKFREFEQRATPERVIVEDSFRKRFPIPPLY